MQPGQARVIGLILVLLALEVVLHPAIKTWLSGLINGWNTALSGAANPAPAPAQSVYSSPTSNPQGTANIGPPGKQGSCVAKPDAQGNCPPGTYSQNGCCIKL